MAPTPGGFVGPSAGRFIAAALALKYPFVFCSGPKEARYRVRQFAPYSFRT
jgi:tetrahydromethanopterin S-methyltransferase subunit C